jgi:hypothetical protein
MSLFGGGALECPVCNKKCYPKEGVQLGETRLHKSCFRCTQCKSVLRANTFGLHEGQYYCQPHLQQLLDESAPGSGGATAADLDNADIVNRTGGVEIGGALYFGMDAETALRRQQNYDLQWELEVRQWLESVLEEKFEADKTLAQVLKSGQ